MINRRSFSVILLLISTLMLTILAWQTHRQLLPLPPTLTLENGPLDKIQILDRSNHSLTFTYQDSWNRQDNIPLHQIPEPLQHIFIQAEDQRFFQHDGVDWLARFQALYQNLISLKTVRGASTVTEQVVRLLHPRPRTLWSRWLEGFEASRLEQQFSKTTTLEFYLNQIPYTSNRRGVVQAARYYFDRDLETLSRKEMLALAVLVRAPSRLDLRRNPNSIEAPLQILAQRLLASGYLSAEDYEALGTDSLQLHNSQLPIRASHFVNYIRTQLEQLPNAQLSPQRSTPPQVKTTLDGQLQTAVQDILDKRLKQLQSKKVYNGAVLVVDHQHNHIVAWVNGGADNSQVPGGQLEAILTPRQPGSTLKPFLYALALEKGWTAATILEDAPLTTAVGSGLHAYRNYSRHYYGPLTLRETLGNSLNTPAIRTVQFVGTQLFLDTLHRLGMSNLTASAQHYGEGLALGNGGISLFELVQAYTVLARQGHCRPLTALHASQFSINPISLPPTGCKGQIFSPEITSLIANILSDPEARHLEFGGSSLLQFPVQTAVKTGTSTDYRDAWALGFNYRYTVGVWLGNLSQRPMSEVSGSSGAALILRAIFAELTRFANTQPLYLSPKLAKLAICPTTGELASADCPGRYEWFIPESLPNSPTSTPRLTEYEPIEKDGFSAFYLQQPTEGLQLALDPRIPDEYEAFALRLHQVPSPQSSTFLEWLIDGQVLAETGADTQQILWPVQKGTHSAQVRYGSLLTPKITFYVK